MTGCYKVTKTRGRKVKRVEHPNEVITDLDNWWHKAKIGDKFTIECELED